tara:strand:+ start:13390 stop:13713 length:324 start_codon:yes stop_codon:yes gene_type:complete
MIFQTTNCRAWFEGYNHGRKIITTSFLGEDFVRYRPDETHPDLLWIYNAGFEAGTVELDNFGAYWYHKDVHPKNCDRKRCKWRGDRIPYTTDGPNDLYEVFRKKNGL